MSNEKVLQPRMLSGAKAIAAYLGVTQRQIHYWNGTGRLPTFRMGNTICARPETLEKWLLEIEAEQRRQNEAK